MKIFRTYSFTWLQMGLLKLCLYSIGILFGVYFVDFFSVKIMYVWVIAIVLFVYFVGLMLRGKV